MADPLSIAGSVAGLVAIADAVFTRILRYTKAFQKSENDMKDLGNAVRELSGLLHGLQLVFAELEDDSDREIRRLHHIHACRMTLMKMQKKLDSHDIHGDGKSKIELAVRKLKWPFSQAEVKELLLEIEQHKTTINLSLSGDTLAAALKALSRQDIMATDIREMKEANEARLAAETRIKIDEKRKKVLKYFERVDPKLTHRTNLRIHHPLTGLWLTESEAFDVWMHTRNTKLWLSGIPGAGKSILTACVIEEAIKESSPDHAVAYYYCDYKSTITQDPVNIFGSLAVQAARQNEAAFLILQELYDDLHALNGELAATDFLELLKAVRKITSCFGSFTAIVDGLDECGLHTTEAVQSLVSLTLEQSNVRSLLSSRAEQDIRQILQEEYSHIEIAAHREDLELYVAAEIEARQSKFGRERLCIRSPELKDHIKKTLVDKAQGMFRWVACQLDLLAGLPTDDAKRKALNSLPPTLFKTYERILERVIEGDPSIQVLVQRTLQWIIHGHTRLTIDAICEAISVNDGDKAINNEAICQGEDILLHCSSFIRKTEDGNHIELAHFTVQEFLFQLASDPGSPFAAFSQAKSYVIPILAKTCCTYLTLEDFNGSVIEDLDEWQKNEAMHPFREVAVTWDGLLSKITMDVATAQYVLDLFNSPKSNSFLSWARDRLFFGGPKIFEQATRAVCMGNVGPLHMAAALGLPELCSVISSTEYINQMSKLGTAFHWAILGFLRIRYILSGQKVADAATMGPPTFKESKSRIMQILVQHGADLSSSFRDNEGILWSTAKLMLLVLSRDPGTNLQPFLELVRLGMPLEHDIFTYFRGLNCCHIYCREESLNDLTTTLEATGQEESIKLDLFNATVEHQRTCREKPLVIIHGPQINLNGFSNMSRANLEMIFQKAIRFDQTAIMEQILQHSNINFLDRRDDFLNTFLHDAASYDSCMAAELLLSRGADVNALNADGATALHGAVAQESKSGKVVSLLLKHGASTAVVDNHDCTVWNNAAEYDNVLGLQALLELDENPDSRNMTCEDFIPIYTAGKSRSRGAFEVLLQHMNNLEDLPLISPEGLGLIHYAVLVNSMVAVRFLETQGTYLTQETGDGRNALHFLPQNADVEIVSFLIDAGLDPDKTNNEGFTPLHCWLKREWMFDANDGEYIEDEILGLLATEKSVNLEDNTGLTILHYLFRWHALQDNHVVDTEHLTIYDKILEISFNYDTLQHYFNFFLSCGLDVHKRDTIGDSCLQLLFKIGRKQVKSGRHRKMTFALQPFISLVTSIANSITDVNFLQDELKYGVASYRLLNWAIEMKATSLAQLLLSKGVDSNLQTKYKTRKWSAIQTACFFGCEKDLFDELLSCSTAIHEPDAEGNYLPHLACLKQSHADVNLLGALCNRGIDLNSRNIHFQTPLMVAAEVGRADVVSLLLEKGADTSAKTASGWNIICFALTSGNPIILKQLWSLDLDWTLTFQMFHPSLPIATKCNVLHQACFNGAAGSIDFILTHEIINDLNLPNGEGWSAIHIAAAFGSAMTVETLIKFGANLDYTMGNGQRPIHCAAINGNLDTTRTLLEHQCLLDPDFRGITPEIYALKFSHMKVVEALRQHKARQDVMGDENFRQSNSILDRSHIEALYIASRTGDLSLCQEVLGKLQISDNLLSHCSGCNLVSVALMYNHPSIAAYLVDKGVHTSGVLCNIWGNLCGYSALHIASCFESYTTVLKKLLEKNSTEESLYLRAAVTPLHLAVACQNLKGLEILLNWFHERGCANHTNCGEREQTSTARLAEGASDQKSSPIPPPSPPRRLFGYKDINVCDTKIAAKLGRVWPLWIVHRLKTNRRPLNTNNRLVNTDFPGIQGATALHIAAFQNNIDAAKILLSYGANVHAYNSWGSTPLHIAANYGYLTSVKFLIERKARVNDCDHTGATATMLAAEKGHNLVLEYLISEGASLQHKDMFDRTILHFASLSSPQVLSHLLIQGCNPYARATQRRFPLDIAIDAVHLGGAKTMFLLLNWSLDFALFDGIISSRRYGQDDRFMFIRALFKRIPNSLISREIDKSTHIAIKDSPLLQAVRGGCLKILDLLIRYGADLNHEGGQNGPALHAACRWGRFSIVKYLVRAGAKQCIHKDGKLAAAIVEAKEYPEIVRWLLVERHTEQPKICWASASSDCNGDEIAPWSGIMTVEVPITGLYSPIHGASSLDKARQMAQLRRELRGTVVYY